MERKTNQRKAIFDALENTDRPLSPNEILEEASLLAPGLGIATVYRNLKQLKTEGRIIEVPLPGEPPRYEISGKIHHHHFHCRSCNRLYEIEGCTGDYNQMLPSGFQLESHEVILYGLCEECTNGNGR